MISIRETFGKELLELGKKYSDLLVVSCDLKGATKANYFFEAYPDRSFEVGIAEANAIGIASGLSMSGYKVVLSSFGSFLAGKNLEIRTSIAYNNAPVVLVGTHGGLIGPDGATQSGIQDIATMRSIPSFEVFQPSTPVLTKKILQYCVNSKSPCYIRVARNEVPEIYEDNLQFIPGNHIIINKIKDINIISSGPMLHNSIEASKILKNKHNIEIGVIDIPSIHPFNQQSFINEVKNSKFLFSIEDHMEQGGLGSLIAEVLSSSGIDAKLYIKGLKDFPISGKPNELESFYKLDPLSIVDYILSKI